MKECFSCGSEATPQTPLEYNINPPPNFYNLFSFPVFYSIPAFILKVFSRCILALNNNPSFISFFDSFLKTPHFEKFNKINGFSRVFHRMDTFLIYVA